MDNDIVCLHLVSSKASQMIEISLTTDTKDVATETSVESFGSVLTLVAVVFNRFHW